MRNLSILVAAAMLAVCAISCKNKTKNTENMATDPMDGPVVEMKTNKGTMKIKLYNATPKHRDNFIKLVEDGFYNTVKFHRVINGFMIQGGDPLSKDGRRMDEWGTGGPDYTIPAEFVPELKHVKGALAAARMGDMANPRRSSSGSQFYIVQSESGCRHLDGQYTVFGQVVEGLEVIDSIATVETDPYDRPLMPVFIDMVRVVKPDGPAAPDEPVDSSEVADTLAD